MQAYVEGETLGRQRRDGRLEERGIGSRLGEMGPGNKSLRLGTSCGPRLGAIALGRLGRTSLLGCYVLRVRSAGTPRSWRPRYTTDASKYRGGAARGDSRGMALVPSAAVPPPCWDGPTQGRAVETNGERRV